MLGNSTGRCSCLKYLLLGCPVEKWIQMFPVFFGIRAIEGLLTVLFSWLLGINGRKGKNGLKPDTEYIKKVLSFKLDYKVTIGDCCDLFLICLEQRTYLMLNSFHVLIKSQVLFPDILVSSAFFSGVLTSTLALPFSIWIQKGLQSNIMDLFFCVYCPNTYNIVHSCPSQWIHLQFTGTLLSDK